MFFAKSLIVLAVLASQALAHAVIAPALGVQGTAIIADVSQPLSSHPPHTC